MALDDDAAHDDRENCLFRCLARVLPGRMDADYHGQELVCFMRYPEIDALLSPFLTPNDRLIHPDFKAQSRRGGVAFRRWVGSA